MGYIRYGLYPVWVISGMGYIRYGLYPVWVISGMGYMRYGLYPVWVISGMGYIRHGLYPVWVISGIGYIRYGLYAVWVISGMGYIRYGLYPVWVISGMGYTRYGLCYCRRGLNRSSNVVYRWPKKALPNLKILCATILASPGVSKKTDVKITKTNVKTMWRMDLFFNCIKCDLQSTMVYLYININRSALNHGN